MKLHLPAWLGLLSPHLYTSSYFHDSFVLFPSPWLSAAFSSLFCLSSPVAPVWPSLLSSPHPCSSLHVLSCLHAPSPTRLIKASIQNKSIAFSHKLLSSLPKLRWVTSLFVCQSCDTSTSVTSHCVKAIEPNFALQMWRTGVISSFPRCLRLPLSVGCLFLFSRWWFVRLATVGFWQETEALWVLLGDGEALWERCYDSQHWHSLDLHQHSRAYLLRPELFQLLFPRSSHLWALILADCCCDMHLPEGLFLSHQRLLGFRLPMELSSSSLVWHLGSPGINLHLPTWICFPGALTVFRSPCRLRNWHFYCYSLFSSFYVELCGLYSDSSHIFYIQMHWTKHYKS